MLREKLIYTDKTGKDKLLFYHLRGESDKHPVVKVTVGRGLFGGESHEIGPGESVRFVSEKEKE
jgi:hypothetical protein